MKKNNKIKTNKTLKKENWLKTCCEILQVDKLDKKDKEYALKTLKLAYKILLTDSARAKYIDELKRKAGISDE